MRQSRRVFAKASGPGISTSPLCVVRSKQLGSPPIEPLLRRGVCNFPELTL